MKFTCTQENLNKGLVIVSRLVGKTTSLPILENIFLSATKSGLELRATNLELGVITTVRGKTETEGEILAPARLLNETVALFSNDNINLSTKDNNLEIKNSKQKASVRGLLTEDFPVIPQIDKGEKIIVSTVGFKEALARVCFAVNADESRPEISGVCLLPEQNNLLVVGTDSYRLAESKLDLNGGALTKKVVLSLRAAQEITHILNNELSDTTQLIINDNQVLCEVGDTKITSRLVGSDYPEYKPIIPNHFNNTFLVNKNELIKAVRAASLFVRSGINDIKLLINSNNKTLQITASNSQLGDQNTELEIKNVVGEDMEIVFNYKYLLDGLQVINTEQIEVGLVNSKDPGVFKPEKNNDYQYIVMPIRQ